MHYHMQVRRLSRDAEPMEQSHGLLASCFILASRKHKNYGNDYLAMVQSPPTRKPSRRKGDSGVPCGPCGAPGFRKEKKGTIVSGTGVWSGGRRAVLCNPGQTPAPVSPQVMVFASHLQVVFGNERLTPMRKVALLSSIVVDCRR